MRLPRRDVLRLLAASTALPAMTHVARADTYPSRPVHMIIGFPGGSAPDIIGRLIGQWLSEKLGQQFVIENRPGAGSNIATESVVRADPDGYTIILDVLSNVLNASLYEHLSFNFIHDIAAVAGVANAPYVMLVTPSLPVKTVPEFIAYAKTNPGKINFASGGIGTSTHIFGVLFMMMTGTELVHVPYRTNYMPDLMSGQVQMIINPIPQSMEFVKDGRVRALAVTTPARLYGAARPSDRQRIRAGLRRGRLVRYRRAEEHAGRHRRGAQRGDRDCARRCKIPGKTRHAWRRADAEVARRDAKIHRRRG